MSRQISTRNWFIAENKVQNDAPVDIASGLAGSDLEVRQIDLSHY